jgi:hypothetical protein
MAAGDPGSPARYYSSTAIETALSGAIGAQAQGAANTSFIVGSVSGFPTSYPYTLIVDPDTSKEEVLTVFAGSGTTLSVYRGADSTQGVAHSAGAVVRHGVSGRDFRESENHIAARGYDIDQTILDAANQTHVHGIATTDGVIVGTLKTQTLTNKTLTSPTITNPSISGAGVDASIVFEGATADAHETTLTVAEPTQDNTITLPNTTGTVVLTTAVQTLTNKTMGDALNAGGYKITNLATPTLASDAVRKDFADAQVAAAATSAASAATSATSAATSATSAAASAATAAASVATIAGYATASANSASAAATSATSAAASATASAASASASAASATAAATSATSAAASATAAATSATSAAASATAAATSATSAAASATTAAASVATIAGYATASANSASASATSATSAAASATAAATSATSAATSATSSALSYTTFNDQYLGSKSTAPTLNNSGGPLVNGNLYFNTTDSTLYVRNAGAWQAAAVSTSGFATLGTNAFTAAQTITVASGTAVPLTIQNNGTGNSFVVNDVASDTTPFVIDADGRALLGHASAGTVVVNAGLQVSGTGGTSYVSQTRFSADANGPGLLLSKSRGSSYTSRGTVVADDVMGQLAFNGDDGTNYVSGANVYGYVDGTVSTGVVPGRLVFSTASSAGTMTERMRIDSSGAITIGNGSAPTISLRINRQLTGAVTTYGMSNQGSVQSDVTTSAVAFYTGIATAATAFTLGSIIHYQAVQGTIGAGSTVTNQYGFFVPPGNTGATNNYGFFSQLASAASVWNFYASGTAANYFAGRTGIGATLTSGAMAQVTNTTAGDIAFNIKGAASQTGHLFDVMNSAGTELFYINSSGSPRMQNPFILRADTSSEGGQIELARATDNTIAWAIDVFGSTSTPSLRILDSVASAARLIIDGSGNVNVGSGTGGGTNTGGLSIGGEDVESMIIMGAWL